MNRIIFFYILLVLFFSCSSNKEISKTERIVNLQQSYIENDYLKFFHYFPDTFDSFVAIYGYVENEEETILSILYDDAYYHIEYLFENNNRIDINSFLEKIFYITQHSYWQADAYNYFKINVEKLFDCRYDDFIDYLNSKTNKELEDFWFFVLNGPHPINNRHLNFIIRLQEDNQERQIRIIEKVMNRIKTDV